MKQHVGAQSDALAGDPALEAARAAQRAAAAAVKPQRLKQAHDIGDGDRCPLDPEHGRMFTRNGQQWCAHQSHDGAPNTAASGPAQATRSIWPLNTFEEAVRNYKPVPAQPWSDEPAVVIDGAPGTPPIMGSPNGRPMKNVTPVEAWDEAGRSTIAEVEAALLELSSLTPSATVVADEIDLSAMEG